MNNLRHWAAGIMILITVMGCGGQIHYGPGVLAPDDPVQETITGAAPIHVGDYTITPLARFRITGRVLSKKRYRFGRESRLSPYDLAMGWGRMSDETVLKDITITQSGRWYHWRTPRFPIPRREIETHSANMHIIPANDTVRSVLDDIKRGNVITFSGNLVRVVGKDGWRWISSLSRSDRGGHSCELVRVESMTIIPDPIPANP